MEPLLEEDGPTERGGAGGAPGEAVPVECDPDTLAFSPHRDVAKNALLRWRVFIYWTLLGVFDALVFFFGAYFMFENTTVTSNGQVSANWIS